MHIFTSPTWGIPQIERKVGLRKSSSISDFAVTLWNEAFGGWERGAIPRLSEMASGKFLSLYPPIYISSRKSEVFIAVGTISATDSLFCYCSFHISLSNDILR